MKDSTRHLIIEVSTTLVAFAVELWRKILKKRGDKK